MPSTLGHLTEVPILALPTTAVAQLAYHRRVSDPIPGAGTDDSLFGDREALLRFNATNDGDHPTVYAVLSQLTSEHDAVAQLIKDVLAEPARLAALHDTGLMDGTPKVALDRFAALTAEALGVPYAAVSLVDSDQQVLIGCNDDTIADRTRPIELSICKYAVASGDPLIVDDTTTHPLLADHPMVLNGAIRAYAGFPLCDPGGNAVGTLCAWDPRPRCWTVGQLQILEDLAAAAGAKVFTT